jgi:hypothetical protein
VVADGSAVPEEDDFVDTDERERRGRFADDGDDEEETRSDDAEDAPTEE